MIIGLEFLLGQSWSIYDLLGVVVGHIYWYSAHCYPDRMNRSPLIKTPGFLYFLLIPPLTIRKALFDRRTERLNQMEINNIE